MGDSHEEFVARMGFDFSAMVRGTRAMLDQQKRSASEYESFWQKALDSRDRAEQAANIKSIERERAKAAAILRINSERLAKEVAEQKAANATIAAGSIPANMAGGMLAKNAASTLGHDAEVVAGGYVFSKVTGKLIGKVEENGKVIEIAGKEIAEVGENAKGLGTVFRELQVLVHEGLSGNFRRMAGSAMILASALSAYALVILASVAAIDAVPAWRAYKARKAAAESETEVKDRSESAGENLRQRIELLVRTGRMDKSTAKRYLNALHGNDYDSIQSVLSATNKLMPAGGLDELASSEEIQKNQAKHSENINRIDRESLDAKSKLAYDQADQEDIERRMNYIRGSGLKDYERRLQLSKLQLDLDQAQLHISEDKKDIERKNTEEQQKQLEIQNRLTTLHREQRNVQKEIGGIDRETPTIEDLAGRRFTTRLNKLYGAGGRFDLGAGDGPFAATAQEFELAQKQQMWDIIHGNAVFDKDGNLTGGAAFEDQKRQIAAHNRLSAAGLETPAMKMAAMSDHLKQIQTDIGELLKKAATDGLKINTD